MTRYDYFAMPAPVRGPKIRGARGASARYAHHLTALLNDMAAEGWEFWRAETLHSTERSWLFGRTRVAHELLIFRRQSADALAAQMPQQAPAAPPDAPTLGTPAPDTGAPARPEPRLGPAPVPDPDAKGATPKLSTARDTPPAQTD